MLIGVINAYGTLIKKGWGGHVPEFHAAPIAKTSRPLSIKLVSINDASDDSKRRWSFPRLNVAAEVPSPAFAWELITLRHVLRKVDPTFVDPRSSHSREIGSDFTRLFQRWLHHVVSTDSLRPYPYVESNGISEILNRDVVANLPAMRFVEIEGSNVNRAIHANPSALTSYLSIMINFVGIAHRAPLKDGEESIDRSGREYAASRNSRYGVVIFTQPNKTAINEDFRFHWQYLPFGVAALMVGVYGVFLLMYALSDEGTSIILLKGLGFSVGGWLAGVFFLFHWLSQQ